MKKKNARYFAELLTLFTGIGLLLFSTKEIQLKYQFDQVVLWAGHVLLFLLTVLSLFLHLRGASDKNAQAFFRSVYSSMILRMFGVVLAIIIYASVAGASVNRPSLLLCAGLYFIYMFYEIGIVFRLLKQAKNG